MRPALVGITVGLAGSLWATALIRGLLYEVAPQDPLTFAVVPIALVLVVIAACAAPARQATRIQPAAALRSDA
jgi:putative ABC transport system permease protein